MSLPELKTLLYTTTLGGNTRPVFRHAVQLALKMNARIIMLHVIEPINATSHALIHNFLPEDVIEKLHTEGVSQMHELMQDRVKKFCDEELDALTGEIKLDIATLVEEGNPTDAILRVAKRMNVDMIVMGAENSFGHHSHTTQEVIREAKLPVFVIPT
ncbi:universal stress protein [Nitrincola alkalilacustris]|uniref:universal stress protein n=1 Tax=Nitrincola alkalilacustris TaxID=1571224 RepID=UPI00124E15EA|nr:universal stress protein [Nitrincola alkalilacustris]